MKKIPLFLFLLPSILCLCQETFNLRVNYGFPAAIVTSIVPTDSCYYATGVIADSVPPYNIGSIFLRLDFQGGPLLAKALTHPNKTYETWEPELSPLRDGTFAISGVTYDSVYLPKAMLLIFGNTGDTLLTREYGNPYYPALEFISARAFVPYPDGGYVFACQIRTSNLPDNDVWVVKTDSIGAIEWTKELGNNHWDIPRSLALDKDNNIIVGAFRANVNLTTENYTYQAYITALDSLGNKLWDYLTPNSIGLRDAANDMLPLGDGSLIVASGVGWEQERASVNEVWFDKHIFKLSHEREIEWELTFPETELSGAAQTTTLVDLSDNSGFVMVGTEYEKLEPPVFSTIQGWIGKISHDGDSVWTRRYAYLTDTPNEHKLYDIKETPDGGFILCGESRDWDGSATYPQQGWLLKLDEHGCLVPGCHLTDAVNEEGAPEIQMAIYPNPASDYLNFYLKTARPAQGTTFRVVDAAGHVVKEFQSTSVDATFIVPVWEWAAGVYFLQYLDPAEKVLLSEKFVIAR